MALPIPYTFIQCPCSDLSAAENGNTSSGSEELEENGERTFDPRAPRSNYSLYPLEHLLYCEDCQQIRCPRCVTEEIVTYYCPNCLFEVPSSNLRSEGNRYVCPGSSPSRASLNEYRLTQKQGVRGAAINARSALARCKSRLCSPPLMRTHLHPRVNRIPRAVRMHSSASTATGRLPRLA